MFWSQTIKFSFISNNINPPPCSIFLFLFISSDLLDGEGVVCDLFDDTLGKSLSDTHLESGITTEVDSKLSFGLRLCWVERELDEVSSIVNAWLIVTLAVQVGEFRIRIFHKVDVFALLILQEGIRVTVKHALHHYTRLSNP